MTNPEPHFTSTLKWHDATKTLPKGGRVMVQISRHESLIDRFTIVHPPRVEIGCFIKRKNLWTTDDCRPIPVGAVKFWANVPTKHKSL